MTNIMFVIWECVKKRVKIELLRFGKARPARAKLTFAGLAGARAQRNLEPRSLFIEDREAGSAPRRPS